MSRPAATALMTSAAASWGVSTVTTKVALGGLAPTDLFAIELVSATVVLWTVLIVSGQWELPRAWRWFVVLGLLEPGLSFLLFDIGLARTGAADAAILLATEGVLAALLAWAALGERLSRTTCIALAAGMAGSALVTLEATGHGASLLGDLLVLGGSATAAAGGVAARRLLTDTSALSGTAIQLLAATALALPTFAVGAASGHSRLQHAGPGHLLAALATGVLGGALPFLLFNIAIRRITVAAAGLMSNLTPLIAMVLAVALLGERPAVVQLVGGLLVIAAALATSEASAEPEPEASLA